jgi:hypothetical protein
VVLAKLIETKDNFDVDALMRTLVKFRPGAFTNKLQFYVTYAVGLRMSATGGWMVTEVGFL